MIYIKNLEPNKPKSVRAEYAIKVNDKHIASFYHKPEWGLVSLLQIAAAAVDAKGQDQ